MWLYIITGTLTAGSQWLVKYHLLYLQSVGVEGLSAGEVNSQASVQFGQPALS